MVERCEAENEAVVPDGVGVEVVRFCVNDRLALVLDGKVDRNVADRVGRAFLRWLKGDGQVFVFHDPTGRMRLRIERIDVRDAMGF